MYGNDIMRRCSRGARGGYTAGFGGRDYDLFVVHAAADTPPLEHQNRVTAAAFSPDGTRIVTASYDKTAQVWDATTGKPLTPPFEHRGAVWTAAFSPDGTRIVTASNDKTARVWTLSIDMSSLDDWRLIAPLLSLRARR